MKNIKSLFFLSALALVWACSFAQAATRTSSQSGNWSATSTWGGSAVPGSADLAVIANGHTVTYDVTSTTVAGITINAGGTLEFTPGTSRTLQSTKNVEVQGTLKMRPSSASVIHTLKFMGIVESNFVGGGDVVLASDVGLWVMGAGKLDAVGTAKTAWARASGAIASGATGVTLGTTPSGWAVGDEIAITPTEAPILSADGKKVQVGLYSNFDDKTLTSVSGATLGWSGGLLYAHPMVNGQWTAEVMNLTRNVRIEGESFTQRTHVFINSTAPQTIKYVQIRYVGLPIPGFVGPDADVQDHPTGRYGIHIHKSDTGYYNGDPEAPIVDPAKLSTIEGMVIRNAGNHAYVPHLSHGILFKDCIGYDLLNDAMWWDNGKENATEYLTFDGCIMAKINPIPNVSNNERHLHGFVLGSSKINFGNVIKNCVAVGSNGSSFSAGFAWPPGANAVWDFSENNITHNHRTNGINVWQNSSNDHVVENFVVYHNKNGIDHGSYNNHYLYRNGTVYGNAKEALNVHALPHEGGPPVFENMMFDGGGITIDLVVFSDHTTSNNVGLYTRFLDCTLQNQKTGGNAVKIGGDPDDAELVEFIDCTIDANEFWLTDDLITSSIIRVQNGTTAFELRQKNQSGTLIPAWNARKTDISPFYP